MKKPSANCAMQFFTTPNKRRRRSRSHSLQSFKETSNSLNSISNSAHRRKNGEDGEDGVRSLICSRAIALSGCDGAASDWGQVFNLQLFDLRLRPGLRLKSAVPGSELTMAIQPSGTLARRVRLSSSLEAHHG